jgi:Stage II sporulation protein E (SpoIIE)
MKIRVLIPVLCGLACVVSFVAIWYPVAWFQLARFEDMVDGLEPLNGQCEYITSPWSAANQSFDTALRMDLPKKIIAVPLPPANELVKVDFDHFVRYRCTFDSHEVLGNAKLAWIFMGSIFGDSAFYINGQARGFQRDGGYAEVSLLPKDLAKPFRLDIISRRVSPDIPSVGPCCRNIFISDSLLSKNQLRSYSFKFYTIVGKGRAAICIALMLVLSFAWASGMRYRDLGWLILILTCQCLAAVFSVRYEWARNSIGWKLQQLVNVAVVSGAVGFSLSFLRNDAIESRFRRFVVPIGLMILGIAFVAEFFTSSTRFYFQNFIICLLMINYLIFSARAMLQSMGLIGYRRWNVTGFAIAAFLAGCVYAIQFVGSIFNLGGGTIAPLGQPMITLAFTVFLGTDLVLFQRRMTQERQIRNDFERKNTFISDQMTLGQSLQNLLLKPTSFFVSPTATCSFSYRPHIHLAGDWASIWEANEGLCVAVGDVSGKGAPAGLAMATIMGLMQRIKSRQLTMSEALASLNRSLGELLQGNLMSTWTALVVSKDQNLEIGSAGSVGWFIWDGMTLKHYATRSEIIGVQEVITPEFKRVATKDWKIAITVSDGICATGRTMKQVADRLAALLKAGSSDAEIMDAMYDLGKTSDVPDDQSVIVVRQVAGDRSEA